jgi:hypothetical protein
MKRYFLTMRQLSAYSETYGCGGTEATHVCHDCPEGTEREFARTRLGGFVKLAYLATLLTAPTTLATWTTGIANGSIILLPKTSGSYDPGDPKELKGFGDRKVSYGPRTMKLMLNDPDYVDNYHFYNEIGDRTDLVPFFGTSSLIHIFDKPASIKAKDPVVDDLEEEVIWNVECEIVSKNLPRKVARTAINSAFVCSTF